MDKIKQHIKSGTQFILVLLYRIIDEKWAESLEHQLLCQTVQVNVDIGNYVVLGLLCTLFKLIWEAIAGDTSLITPPPPEWVQARGSNQHAHWTSHGVM